MSATLYTNESRGGGNYEWLRTKYSYSFSNYYDPNRMGFGALRVVNDDWIAPAAGFPTHSHQNMEIITIPLSGALAHKDNAGGEGKIKNGMVQVMSAGTGVLHSEFNNSETEPVELFQIWIEPNAYHVAPRYQEAEYVFTQEKSETVLLVGPQGVSDIWIHQQAYISRMSVLEGEILSYKFHDSKNGVYMLVITGEGNIAQQNLAKRDALEITDMEEIEVEAKTKMDILVIEIPL